MDDTIPSIAERRKQVKLRLRADLQKFPQRYEGKQYTTVKDPVTLKYYRFNEQEYFVCKMLDGQHTLEDVRVAFEKEFPPQTLKLEHLEGFARELITNGLLQHETENMALMRFRKRKQERLTRKVAQLTNILYIKIPIFDPDAILNWMVQFVRWAFTWPFLILSVAFMLSAVALVTLNFNTFYAKLPSQDEFFRYQTLLYMWLSLGVVKIIHEFGHGLSCKAFGGESHEMGFLLMCFSPAMFCNVTDSWTVASKWKRIIISFAGIYVELIIAATATWVWWFTPHLPFVNNVAMALMTLCSISTFVFNANPLMRYDGYYILADWLEVPNLRERCNKYLKNLVLHYGFGVEVQPEPYMARWRKVLFVVYAITSWVYKWVVTFGILWFLSNWLKPYKLDIVSRLLAAFALGSMFLWPGYRMFKSYRQRGRLPDMKRERVIVTSAILAGLVAAFFFLPLPVSRIRETGLTQIQESSVTRVYVADPGFLEATHVYDGQYVERDQLLATYSNPQMEQELAAEAAKATEYELRLQALRASLSKGTTDEQFRLKLQQDQTEAVGQLGKAKAQHARILDRLAGLREIKAPRAGYVMSPPKKDDLGKYYEPQQPAEPFCSIGDYAKVRVLVPVDSLDFQLLAVNLAKKRELEVTVYMPGRTDRLFKGRLRHPLPETDVHDVPVALTSRGGGPLAVRPANDPNKNEPLVQTYLVSVEILDPDATVRPGTLATVKIHNEPKSLAWWVWRTVSSALDFGLL